MGFAKSVCWCLSCLTLMAAGAYAQDSANREAGSKSVLKKARSPARKSADKKTNALQVRREAETKAKAEREALERAEAEAQAGREAEQAALQKPITDAEELMRNGKPAEAYTLLEPLEFDRAGEVRFDYLLGIAALDSGKPDKATLAFERVLAVDPGFAGARLDMARAYYQLGDLPRAKTEFETVLGQNPPEMAKATIMKYLDAIAAYEEAKRTHITEYIEGTVGHDSNVNTGTGSSIAVSSLSPALAALITGLTGDTNPQIPPSQRADDYYTVNAGGEISRRLGENWLVYAGVDAHQRGNMVQTPYDLASAEGRVGAMYAEDQNAYKLTVTGGQAYLANSMRRDSLGINAEWQHTFSPANQMNVFTMYGTNRAAGFPPTAPGTDARTTGNTDLVIGGAGWQHVMADGKQAVFASAYLGKELDEAPASVVQPPDGKRRFEGVRVGGQAALTDQLDWFANLGWQHGVYAKPNAFIVNNGRRDENQYDVNVGANWRLDKLWSVKPQVSMSRKRSNLAIYSYDRTDISLTVRRDFK